MPTAVSTHSPRCYGYTPEGDVVPEEAKVIRTAVDLLIHQDHSLRATAEALNVLGAETVAGNAWQAYPLRRLLTNPRLSGKGPKRRGSTQPSPAIITPAEQDELLACLLLRRRDLGARGGRLPTRLLAGLVECGRCGADMQSHVNTYGRAYRCPVGGLTQDGDRSCGKTQIQAAPLEEHITQATLDKLVDPAAHPVAPYSQRAAITDRMAALERRRTDLETQRPDLDPQIYLMRRNKIKARRQQLRQQLARAETIPPPPKVLPGPSRVRGWWRKASDNDRRAVLLAMWERIVIGEATRYGHPGLDTERVTAVPRQRPAVSAAS